MGNIGSEISRARRSAGGDTGRFGSAVDHALDLFDLTLADPRISSAISARLPLWHVRSPRPIVLLPLKKQLTIE